MGEGGKEYKVPVTIQISYENVMYSMITIVNNTVYLKIINSRFLKFSLHKKIAPV